MLRIVFAWLALIMQLDYSSAARTCFLAPSSAAQSLWQSRRSTTHFFFEQQLMYAWATETEDCQGRAGMRGRLITVGYNSWRAMATASVLKLKENNYEAAEIEFLITAGRAPGAGAGAAAGAAARHGQGSRTSTRSRRRRKLVLTWKCLQIN